MGGRTESILYRTVGINNAYCMKLVSVLLLVVKVGNTTHAGGRGPELRATHTYDRTFYSQHICIYDVFFFFRLYRPSTLLLRGWYGDFDIAEPAPNDSQDCEVAWLGVSNAPKVTFPTKLSCTACLSQPLSKQLTHQKDMTDPPPAPLRPSRYAKRRRVEPIEASEPELEAVAVQIACETALLCHETVTGASLYTRGFGTPRPPAPGAWGHARLFESGLHDAPLGLVHVLFDVFRALESFDPPFDPLGRAPNKLTMFGGKNTSANSVLFQHLSPPPYPSILFFLSDTAFARFPQNQKPVESVCSLSRKQGENHENYFS